MIFNFQWSWYFALVASPWRVLSIYLWSNSRDTGNTGLEYSSLLTYTCFESGNRLSRWWSQCDCMSIHAAGGDRAGAPAPPPAQSCEVLLSSDFLLIPLLVSLHPSFSLSFSPPLSFYLLTWPHVFPSQNGHVVQCGAWLHRLPWGREAALLWPTCSHPAQCPPCPPGAHLEPARQAWRRTAPLPIAIGID